ncbi:MAG: aminomethyl-transferring glycine dehydrogenase subunit GcvPA [Thermoplasmatota archaeon]
MRIDERMLEEMGISGIEELFSDVPEEIRVDGLDLPEGLSEMEVVRRIQEMLSRNDHFGECPGFLGAGVYHHFIPPAVSSLVGRAEMITSYTPYQAEISQGMLQSLFEYQSYLAELTGLDAANSSNYDASTALGEAANMCHRIDPGGAFLIPKAMSWERKRVLRNYVWGSGMEVMEYDFDPHTGQMDMDDLSLKAEEGVTGIYAEVPNFLGVIDPAVASLKEEFPESLLVVGVNPISLGVLSPPGEYGADIVVGEGQVLGSPMNLGGPLLGIFATRQEYVRKMPGRVIGITTDQEGERAFCMTLQTREQHIRRSRATSNICTNEALMAVAASVYLSLLGKEGLESLARYNIAQARELMEEISDLEGFTSPLFNAHHFNEFAIRCPTKPEKVNKLLLKRGIIGGLPLLPHLPDLEDCMLLATTEMHSRDDHERLVSALREVV